MVLNDDFNTQAKTRCRSLHALKTDIEVPSIWPARVDLEGVPPVNTNCFNPNRWIPKKQGTNLQEEPATLADPAKKRKHSAHQQKAEQNLKLKRYQNQKPKYQKAPRRQKIFYDNLSSRERNGSKTGKIINIKS